MEQQTQQSPPELENENTNVEIVKTEADKPALQVLGDETLKKIEAAAANATLLKSKWKKNKKKILAITIDDKKGRELLKDERAELRTTRLALQNQVKEEVKPFVEAVAFYRNAFGKVIAAIEEMEEPYTAKHKELQEQDKAEEEREELEKKQRVDSRVDQLVKIGASFDSFYYAVGAPALGVPEMSIGMADIEVMSDVLFGEYLAKFSETKLLADEAQEKENTRLETEKKQKEEEEEKTRLKLKEDQDKLEKEKKELEQQKQEAENEKQEMIKMRLETRGAQLEALGMVHDPTGIREEYFYPESQLTLSVEYIGSADKTEWTTTLEEYKCRTIAIADELKKAQEEKDRLAKEQKDKHDKEQALIKSRGEELAALGFTYSYQSGMYCLNGLRIGINRLLDENETWLPFLTELQTSVEKQKADDLQAIKDKAIKDQKDKEEKVKKEAAEKLALQGDEVIFADFVARLKAVEIPAFKTESYQIIAATFGKTVSALVDSLSGK